MPGSQTTRDRMGTCDSAPTTCCLPTRFKASASRSKNIYAAQWLACLCLCQRFVSHLTVHGHA